MLSHVNFPIIQKKYLAQIYCVAPEYAQSVYDLTQFKHKQSFEFSEVEELSKEAPTFHKNPKSRPEEGNRLVGFAPEKPFYQL
ncbi:hypothetical protein KC343_g6726 [Hortaea werneckii]|uniref:Uncharacterized protein n=1 Tax=Hortaea werneckii TaxID=91943 RepID=A0A3M7EW51_HORWE|nr:hypothetical protein KC352_g29700 [Hortaea werneckii]KAI7570926.1 hypothetical protein KC317_g2061 [Hortaea werneckii]KAI7625202.1 hypothetical protein KC343_g6726 [Hortaea werneckii]KAI7625336.1 hypothetical protein KC346_g1771 [Hortaea werneckii]KAI7674219.1 hypothetical protein KC319_g4876 [Hortaea werneckii]